MSDQQRRSDRDTESPDTTRVADHGAGGSKPQQPDLDSQASNPNAGGPDRLAGGMGVSSERTGPTGPGQDSTDGVRPTESTGPASGEDADPVTEGADPTTRF